MSAPARPSVGVAMCVYNGARYLREQLESIAAQSELPDAMVVLDDGSTDGSLELVQSWASRMPFPVRVGRNAQRLGVAHNFEQAVAKLEQDVIFLTDQDDKWYPHKVSSFVDQFAADPELGLLHSDADLIDAQGGPIGRTLLEALVVSTQERDLIAQGLAYRVFTRRNLVTGAACAFRRELLALARPFPAMYLHDEWLAFIAALASKVALLDVPTMGYRLHDANTVGVPLRNFGWAIRHRLEGLALPTAQRQLQRADRLEVVLTHARAIGVQDDAVGHLEAAAAHARFRANLPRNPFSRMRAISRERAAGHYETWSSGSVSVLRDLLLAR